MRLFTCGVFGKKAENGSYRKFSERKYTAYEENQALPEELKKRQQYTSHGSAAVQKQMEKVESLTYAKENRSKRKFPKRGLFLAGTSGAAAGMLTVLGVSAIPFTNIASTGVVAAAVAGSMALTWASGAVLAAGIVGTPLYLVGRAVNKKIQNLRLKMAENKLDNMIAKEAREGNKKQKVPSLQSKITEKQQSENSSVTSRTTSKSKQKTQPSTAIVYKMKMERRV